MRWNKSKIQILLLIVLLAAGFSLRYLLPLGFTQAVSGWRPWGGTTVATLYFFDGPFLFPISRRLPNDEKLPRTALQALLDGPGPKSGLDTAIPHGVRIRSFEIVDGVARADLSAVFRDGARDGRAAEAMVTETLTALPGVSSVEVSVEGTPFASNRIRTPLLYYASAKGLVAVPTEARSPREALTAYLNAPPAPELSGIADARLLAHEYDSGDSLLSLRFAYTAAIREMALDNPARMRTALLGLIATLTEFPEVKLVRLDFGGQSRLGLGECSDLLGAPQPRPALLNDERLLSW
jgi:spore germination protein GerM